MFKTCLIHCVQHAVAGTVCFCRRDSEGCCGGSLRCRAAHPELLLFVGFLRLSIFNSPLALRMVTGAWISPSCSIAILGTTAVPTGRGSSPAVDFRQWRGHHWGPPGSPPWGGRVQFPPASEDGVRVLERQRWRAWASRWDGWCCSQCCRSAQGKGRLSLGRWLLRSGQALGTAETEGARKKSLQRWSRIVLGCIHTHTATGSVQSFMACI